MNLYDALHYEAADPEERIIRVEFNDADQSVLISSAKVKGIWLKNRFSYEEVREQIKEAEQAEYFKIFYMSCWPGHSELLANPEEDRQYRLLRDALLNSDMQRFAELLFQKKFDVNYCPPAKNYDPLINETSDPYAIDLLLKAGANIDDPRPNGTPLERAFIFVNRPLAEFLLNAGADPYKCSVDIFSYAQEPPRMTALEMTEREAMTDLLKNWKQKQAEKVSLQNIARLDKMLAGQRRRSGP